MKLGQYFIKKTAADEWQDVAVIFDGVHVLKIDGINELGKTTNVYTAKWVDDAHEDYFIAGDTIVRENVDLSVTFICGNRYLATPTYAQDLTMHIHDTFIDYVCNGGDFYVYSPYVHKVAHVACLDEYKPTTVHIERGKNSYILGTIKLHCIEPPTWYDDDDSDSE